MLRGEAMCRPGFSEPPQRPANDWRQFTADRAFVKRHRITRRELQAFKELGLLGYVLSRHQVLAILTMIREPGEA